MQPPYPPTPPTPTTVASQQPFFDDFRNGVDPGSWRFVQRSTLSRKQLQCYTADGAVPGRHGLQLILRPAGPDEPGYCHGQPLVAPRLQSQRVFLYGTISVRAKLPAGAGIWPAIWMRTPEGTPFNGEVDLVEGFGSRPDLYASTIHGWAADQHLGFRCAIVSGSGVPDVVFALRHKCVPAVAPAGPNFDQAFHTFTVDWRPGVVTWSLDGRPYHTEHAFVPNVPMAVVLEIQQGGGYDIAPDGTAKLPAALTIRSVSYRPWSG